jgi:hypothetical protein
MSGSLSKVHARFTNSPYCSTHGSHSIAISSVKPARLMGCGCFGVLFVVTCDLDDCRTYLVPISTAIIASSHCSPARSPYVPTQSYAMILHLTVSHQYLIYLVPSAIQLSSHPAVRRVYLAARPVSEHIIVCCVLVYPPCPVCPLSLCFS